MSRSLACVYLACAMLMTGANVPVGKVIVATLPIYAFAFLRFMSASMLLAVLDHRETGLRLSELSRRDWRDVVAMTVMGMVLYTIFILEGVKRTSAIDAGIILATLPAIVAILGAIFMRERPGRFQAAAVVLAAAGIGLILTGGTASTAAAMASATAMASSLLGNALVGAAVLGEAGFVLLSRRLSGVLSPVRLAFAGSLVAAVASLPLVIATGELNQLADVPPVTWALAAWYMISASILNNWLWYRGVGHVETWMAGICTACIPVAALAVSVVALGEKLSIAQAAGAAFVVVAILVGSLMRRES